MIEKQYKNQTCTKEKSDSCFVDYFLQPLTVHMPFTITEKPVKLIRLFILFNQ